MSKTARRPSESYALPHDTSGVWERLTTLADLTWPTLAEQVERRALIAWLRPNANAIDWMSVLKFAYELTHEGPQSGEQFQLPALTAARTAWENIRQLAGGGKLQPARVELNDSAGFEPWSELRKTQALDWWQTAMKELDELLTLGVISSFDLPEHTTCQTLMEALRRHFMREPFDGPMAIGASIYLEPGLPGTGLGSERQTLYVMEALAFAVNAAVATVRAAGDTDEMRRTTTIMRLEFFWQLLKGYTWASRKIGMGTPLPELLAYREDIWEAARHALLLGRDALAIIQDQSTVHFMRHGGGLSAAIATSTTEELIAEMDASIAEGRRTWEQLRNMR